MNSRCSLATLAIGFAFALIVVSRPVFADANPELTLKTAESVEWPSGVEVNLRTVIDLGRYPCQPAPGQKALIQRQVRSSSETALQALGFYQPRLESQWTAASDDRCFALTLTVDTGPATRIRTLDIRLNGDAADDPAFQRAIDSSGLKEGQRLRHDRYSKLKQSLQQLLINRGYAEGTLTRHRLEVDRDRREAKVLLEVDSGPRYRFGEIKFTGDQQINQQLRRAYLRFESGEPFSNDKLLTTQQAYLGAGYFSAVRLNREEPNTENQTIDINIHFSPRNEWALRAGAGASTDTGPRVRLGVENRRVNGAGHTARIETEFSEVRQGVGAGYTIPLSDPINEKIELRTRYVNEDTDTSESEIFSTSADYIIQLDSNWVATTSLEYLRETYTIADQVDDVELVIPGFQLSRVRYDDPIYPRFGWRLGGKVRGTHKTLGSSASFTQFDGWAKLILPLFKGRIITRGELGYTEVSNVTKLPASLRFFAGGDSSVRGFAYQSLGPRDKDDEVIGGRHLLVSSLEYDYPISEHWSVAVFSDAGNAFNNFNDYEIRRSAGFGVRWRSPLGPIRVDLARSIEEGRQWRLHLSMGPDL